MKNFIRIGITLFLLLGCFLCTNTFALEQEALAKTNIKGLEKPPTFLNCTHWNMVRASNEILVQRYINQMRSKKCTDEIVDYYYNFTPLNCKAITFTSIAPVCIRICKKLNKAFTEWKAAEKILLDNNCRIGAY